MLQYGYAVFTIIIYIGCIIYGICKLIRFRKKITESDMVSTVDALTKFVFVVVTALYCAFLIEGYVSYFRQYEAGVYMRLPWICNSVLIVASFYFLFSQNFVAYNETSILVGGRCLSIKDLGIRKVNYSPLGRMHIYLKDLEGNKYVLRIPKKNGDVLTTKIEGNNAD